MSNNNVSREQLANALAVASRLSATEMRDLHALLLKGGDDVLKKTVKRSSTKRKGKKKVKKKRSSNKSNTNNNIATVKPRFIVNNDDKVVYQAWPAREVRTSTTQIDNNKVKVKPQKDINVQMSELGLRQHGASVAVAETFAREAFGNTLDEENNNINEEETKDDTATETETAEEEEDDDDDDDDGENRTKKKRSTKRRRLKKRRKKGNTSSKSNKMMIKWDPSTSTKGYPRGTDTVNAGDQITNWSASFGPMKYKLGKAKAAIQVYRGQINVKDKEKGKLSKRLTTEQNEHDYTRMKLLAQEYLFVKCMEMCKKIELAGKAEKMNMPIGDRAAYAALNAEEEVRSMLKESVGGGSIKDVVKQAEIVATNIIGNVEKIIASKQADIDAAKQSYEELNQRLEQQVIQNANLSDLLSSQTSSIERLSNELEESQNVNRDLNIELNGMQIQMDRIKEENKTLKNAMSGQTKELEKYVDTLIDSIRKRFGYVPPQLKLTAFFGAPTFAHLSKEFWREP